MAILPRILILCLLVLGGPLAAQTGIAGRVVAAETSRPLAGIAVSARRATDTATVARTVSGTDGRFQLRGLAPGRYVVRAFGAGRQATMSAPVTVAGAVADAGDLRMDAVVALEALQVRVQRPPVVHAEDRNVYSVQDMPTAIGGAADVMRTLPELEVDLEGGIKMVGNRPVTIHINGRPSPMKGQALTEFIRNLPADRIDRIEVISNPSVRFEGGDAAIVNIVLRKGVQLGLSGSVSLNGATRGGNGVSGQVAYQRGRLTLFGGGSSNLTRSSDASRELRQNLLADPITFLDLDRTSEGNSYHGSADLTAELTVGPRETLWASGSSYLGGYGSEGISHNRLLDAGQLPTRVYDRLNNGDSDFQSTDAAVGFRRIVEAQRDEVSVELRVARNSNSNVSRFLETTLETSLDTGGPLSELRLTDMDQAETELVAKADYMHPVLGKRGRIETGVRSSRTEEDSDNILRLFAPMESAEPRQSSDVSSLYVETQHSAYANLSHRLGRVSLQGGLRAELTRLDLQPRGANPLPGFQRDFFAVFPTANLSFQLTPARTLRMNYSRRMRRPSIWDLNPYVQQTDPLSVRLGNPELEPAATHSLGMDLSWRMKVATLRLAPYYRRTEDEVEFFRTVSDSGVLTTLPRNLATVESYGSTLNASLSPARWGNASLSLGATHDERDAGELGPAYSRSGTNYFLNANTTLQPGRGVGVQMSLRMMRPRVTPQGRFSSTPATELGIRKELFNRKGSLSLRIVDPFDIYRSTFTSNDPTFAGSTRSSSSWVGRSVSASFTLRFGGKPPERKSTEGQGPPSGGGGAPPS